MIWIKLLFVNFYIISFRKDNDLLVKREVWAASDPGPDFPKLPPRFLELTKDGLSTPRTIPILGSFENEE